MVTLSKEVQNEESNYKLNNQNQEQLNNILKQTNKQSKAEDFIAQAHKIDSDKLNSILEQSDRQSIAQKFITQANNEKQNIQMIKKEQPSPMEIKLRIKKLAHAYEAAWHRKIDFNILPYGMNEERCIITLQRIIYTGERLLEGYNKLYRPYIYMKG